MIGPETAGIRATTNQKHPARRTARQVLIGLSEPSRTVIDSRGKEKEDEPSCRTAAMQVAKLASADEGALLRRCSRGKTSARRTKPGLARRKLSRVSSDNTRGGLGTFRRRISRIIEAAAMDGSISLEAALAANFGVSNGLW